MKQLHAGFLGLNMTKTTQYLVGGWATLWKILVNWDDEIPNTCKKKRWQPNHQPGISCRTTKYCWGLGPSQKDWDTTSTWVCWTKQVKIDWSRCPYWTETTQYIYTGVNQNQRGPFYNTTGSACLANRHVFSKLPETSLKLCCWGNLKPWKILEVCLVSPAEHTMDLYQTKGHPIPSTIKNSHHNPPNNTRKSIWE